jgi:uncharacterized cupredoxin-like copper-binding protein
MSGTTVRSSSRLGVLLGAVAVAALLAVIVTGWSARAGGPPTVDIGIRFSEFSVSEVHVPSGTPVTFVLRNDDPIDHEWIVGDAASHERHRTGTEPVHESRPTEVTIPALEDRTTVVTFETPGRYLFICHLPGHELYGMTGVVVVDP